MDLLINQKRHQFNYIINNKLIMIKIYNHM